MENPGGDATPQRASRLRAALASPLRLLNGVKSRFTPAKQQPLPAPLSVRCERSNSPEVPQQRRVKDVEADGWSKENVFHPPAFCSPASKTPLSENGAVCCLSAAPSRCLLSLDAQPLYSHLHASRADSPPNAECSNG